MIFMLIIMNFLQELDQEQEKIKFMLNLYIGY